MNQSISIPVSDVTSKFTITVTINGMRSFKVRAWFGVKLIELASLVMGMRCEVDLK